MGFSVHRNKGLLLEYIKPGLSLKTLFNPADATTVKIAAQVIQKMHSNPHPQGNLRSFHTINQWCALLKTYKSATIPASMIHKAERLSNRLLHTQGKLYLLHGDLHQENILQQSDSWVAIDPKGVVGELEYEIGAFMRNPVPELLEQENVEEIISARIDQFSEIFGFEKQRLIDWTFVQAVLAACWSEHDYFSTFANKIENITSAS